MSEMFDSDAIVNRGWRQGAVLGPELTSLASKHAPESVDVSGTDLLILTSHDCDIVNPNIDKEPFVEVLKANVALGQQANKQYLSGRNPRILQFVTQRNGKPALLSFAAYNRWTVPRTLLMSDSAEECLPDKERRLIAEWLAKRYIRTAFPTAFDQRWRSKLKDWRELLKRYSEWLQGVYMRLNTLRELPAGSPYKCHFILAVPHSMRGLAGWAEKRSEMEQAIEIFWDQFKPTIQFVGVDVLGTDEITLADIEPYQRFDAEWVSFEDETATSSIITDMA